jgi:predicted phosphodiesterase
MALSGILGDVHGNREALAAVLGFFDRRGVARVLCTGDIVGYNADATACVALLRARGALAVAGNHDLICVGRLGYARCSAPAEYALRRTRRRLGAETAAYLRALPAWRAPDGRILLVHGSVADVERRLATPGEVCADAERLRAAHPQVRLCFYGHLHAQKVFEIDGASARELACPPRASWYATRRTEHRSREPSTRSRSIGMRTVASAIRSLNTPDVSTRSSGRYRRNRCRRTCRSSSRSPRPTRTAAR